MPRNFTGGKGHRSGQNSESTASSKSKKIFEDLLSDLRHGEDLSGVFVGRVTKKLGDGRMEVVYFNEDRLETVKAIIKGSLRGRSKRDAFIDVNSFVLLVDLGVDSGTTHEIMSVFTDAQVQILRKEADIDDRLFAIENKETKKEDNVEFDHEEEEINIDTL
jgi:hypothetical protein